MSKSDYIQIERLRDFINGSCKGIEQKMLKVTPKMADRAIWELFQNAGDLALPSVEGHSKASIKVELTPSEFIFSHKGAPFTFLTLEALVKQKSSKEDEFSTGQYGTGFITTHSFGKNITLFGSMEEVIDPKEVDATASLKRYVTIDGFRIERDYPEGDIKAFEYMMADQLNKVSKIAESDPDTDTPREWTEFHYDLSTAIGGNGLKKASSALEAAIKVMPFLMTINPKIAEVKIINHTTGQNISFSADDAPEERGLKVMSVTKTENGVITTDKIYYIASADRNDVIILPLKSLSEARKLDGIAKIFVSYPLLETENFGSEFIFHSSRFTPTEPRNGLELPKEGSNAPKKEAKNVEVLNEMSEMLFATLSELQDLDIDWAEILSLNMDEPITDDEVTKEFYRNLKRKWSDFYKSLRVITVDNKKKAMIDGDVCFYDTFIVNSLLSEESTFSSSVYKAASMVGSLPEADSVLKWSQVVASWTESSDSCFLSTECIASKLEKVEVNADTLLGFDLYISAIQQNYLFDKYAIIPNREGEKRPKNELCDASSIPGWLYDIVRPLIPEELRKFVDNRFENIDNFSTYSRGNLRTAINDALTKLSTETFRNKTLKKRCSDEIFLTLIKLSLIFQNENCQDLRAIVMPLVLKHYDIQEESHILSPLSDAEESFHSRPFRDLLENLMLEISLKDSEWVKENVDFLLSIHSSLKDSSLYFSKTEGEGLATRYAIFPNRLGEPYLMKDLKHGEDLDEIIPFYNSALKTDLNESLIDPEFAEFFQKITNGEKTTDNKAIARDIEDKLEVNHFDDDLVLDIIELIKSDVKWESIFEKINAQKAELFLKRVDGRSKESIFKLMKINDPDKLNVLAELAEDEDIDEIIRLGKESKRQQEIQEADFTYRYKLGKYVEEFLRTEVSNRLESCPELADVEISVPDVQAGQDMIVLANGKPIYYIEVKSRWSKSQSVEMSPAQMDQSIRHKEHYALCCLDMSHASKEDAERHIYPDVEETISHLRSITNIGEKLERLAPDTNTSDSDIHIGGQFKVVVPQTVISQIGKSFDYLIDTILSNC